MRANGVSAPESANFQQAERFCIAALLFLTLAIFFLSIVTFTANPVTVLGKVAISIGVVLMILCIICFFFYDYYEKLEERQSAA